MLGEAIGQAVLGGRYRLTRLLKSGQGVVTLQGTDLSTQVEVVIKATDLLSVSPGTQLRLEHEADVLRHLANPSLTPLLDLGRDGDEFYLVMPYVPGHTLAERLQGGPLSTDDTVAIGVGLMRALQSAHDDGVLHRDLKPANIIVGEGSPPGRVTLIDFGLARSGRLEASLRDLPVGTIAYLSPEQAGLLNSEVGERSDLYSAGVSLFECLTGHVPFEGPTVGELLRQISVAPPELRGLGLPVPRALDEVIQRLLRKDPRDRYQTAAAVLSDLEEIAAALEHGEREPALVTGARDRRRTLTEPAFVDREAELAAFLEELAHLEAGQSGLVLLEGESGSGKSRLLDELAVAGVQHGAWVLRGRARERSAPHPLQVLDGVVREIVSMARSDREFASRLQVHLGEHAMTLCAMLPALRTVLLAEGRVVTPGPEATGETRSLLALIALLDALGSAERPAMVLLDDCQWADEHSLKLLVEWQKNQRSEGGPDRPGYTLAVAAYRPEEVGEASPLERVHPPRRITLRPLDDAMVGRLAESMAGPLPPEAIALVVRLSDGNPFLAEAVLVGLFEGGALVDTPGGWRIEPEAMAHAQSSRRAGVFLSRRLDGLSPETLRLLSVGAVLGRSFELTLAAELAGQPAAAAIAAVAAARRRHLVWFDARTGACQFVHDRIRTALLDRLPNDDLQRLHRLAAEAFERDEEIGPDTEFELAYHFDRAGDPARALPHAMRAASQARDRSALEIAEGFYRIAGRGVTHPGVDAAARRQVAEGLGDVLMLRGRYDEAGSHLFDARWLAESPVARSRIEGKLGELAFKRGDVLDAEAALKRALQLLGRRVPARFVSLLLSTLALALLQVVHTVLPRRLIARRKLQDGEADLLAARLYSRLAYVYWFGRGQIATFWAHLSELNLTELYPPTRELAQAYSEHAVSVTGLPRMFIRRGVRYAERGIAIRRALGDEWGLGQSLNFYGILLYAFGYYRTALVRFREALSLLRRTGDRWEENIAGFHIAFCLQHLGALRESLQECRRVYRDALEIGDTFAKATVLEVWAKATGGAVPSELVEASLQSKTGDAQMRESLLQAEGVRLIGAGRPADAAKAFAEGEAVARAAHLRSEYVSYLPLWRCHALRLATVEAEAPLGVPSPDRLRAAEAAMRRCLRLARRYRGHLPMALRERALLSAMRGHRKGRTLRDLDRSLAEARRQGARLEEAQTILARAELGILDGSLEAKQDAVRARARLAELGADCSPSLAERPAVGAAAQPPPVTLSLADRFASIVDQGRQIVSALDAEAIYSATCIASRTLLRGEANMVLALEGEDEHIAVLGSAGTGSVEFSGTLLRRTFFEGRPCELPGSELTESMVIAGVRSAVCAPISVRGRAVACLYVAHGGIAGLFAEDEKRIAGYIGTLAGAALEKAQAFAKIQELSRSLEQRVDERTSQLRDANLELNTNLRRLRETQDQLVQASKMAATGTLVAGLSHELNNPIAVILGRAQSALKQMGPVSPYRAGMMAIERQARRCRDLVSTLLDLSRQGARGREPLDVETLLRHTSELATMRLRHKNIALDVSPSPRGAPPLSVTRTEIESALLNLLDNAIDASQPGGTVYMSAALETHGDRRGVTIYVRDLGPGIPADVLPRIFDPFYTTRPVGEGTGLGLSLSRQFVEGHGGRLSVESTPGEGTTMRLWLPVGEKATDVERGSA